MTIFKIQDHEIINGICPEIPEGTTEVDLSGCTELQTITKIPETVKKLNLKSCKGLKVLPGLPEGVEEIILFECRRLEKITNIPETVKKLNLGDCLNLQVLPKIPEGIEKINLFGCESLEKITNIPGTVKKLNLSRCGTLQVLPEISEGVEEIDLFRCESLEIIPNIPGTVKRFDFSWCEKLQVLPKLPDGVEEIDLTRCESLETIPNIPGTVKKLNLRKCKGLKVLPKISEGVEEINLLDCESLETITNIPGTVKKLNLRQCKGLKVLPEISEGVEEVDLSDCASLETIANIPGTVKKLNLRGCEKLNLTPELITRLEELEEEGCEIVYPEHFNPDTLSAQVKEKLAQITKNYCKENPDQPSPSLSITTVLNRFLTEGIGQRSEESNQKRRAQEIAQSTLPILEILEKNPHLLPVVDKTAGEFLAGCINQPVRAWSEVAALMAIAAQSDILDRLEATKQIFTLDYIAGFVRELPEDQKVGEMFEVEAGNSLYREVHKILLGNKTLKEPWLGVPGSIAYGDSIKPFLTEERIREVTEEVESQIISLAEDELVERICETQHNKAWGEICFPKEVKEIKEIYAKQREKLAEKDFAQWTSEDVKIFKEIDFNETQDLAKKVKEETLAQLAIIRKTAQEVKEIREAAAKESEEFAKKDAGQLTLQHTKKFEEIDHQKSIDLNSEIREKTLAQLNKIDKPTRAEKFRASVKNSSREFRAPAKQRLEGLGKKDVFDPNDDNILTRTSANFYTPTERGLRPSTIQHGDVVVRPKTKTKALSKKTLTNPDTTRGGKNF
jgi:hypothetical protein